MPLFLGLLLVLSQWHVSDGAVAKSSRQSRLRGIDRIQKQRELDSMFSNTRTQHHIEEQYRHSAMEVAVDDPRGPEEIGATAIDVKASEELLHSAEAEEEKTTDDVQRVAPRKEKPKGLYHTARAKSGKSDKKAKDKESKAEKESPSSSDSEQMDNQEFSEDEELPASSTPMEEEVEEEEEDAEEEDPTEGMNAEDESSMEEEETTKEEESSLEEEPMEESSMDEREDPGEAPSTDEDAMENPVGESSMDDPSDPAASNQDDSEESVDMDPITEEAPSVDDAPGKSLFFSFLSNLDPFSWYPSDATSSLSLLSALQPQQTVRAVRARKARGKVGTDRYH